MMVPSQTLVMTWGQHLEFTVLKIHPQSYTGDGFRSGWHAVLSKCGEDTVAKDLILISALVSD